MRENMSPKHYIIIGATSAMAIATARQLSEGNANLSLLGRNEKSLNEIAADLKVRGSEVSISVLDLAKEKDPFHVLKSHFDTNGSVDGILLFYGLLGNQAQAEENIEHAREIMLVNYSSAVEWILAGAQVLEGQGHGTILAISSVAGDRGRKSSFV